MADITPRLAAGRQLINAYGDGGFRVAGIAYRGPIVVLPERTFAWAPPAFEALSLTDFQPLLDSGAAIEILLIGSGAQIRFVPRELRAALKAAGLSVDAMDTGAACRTFNVLLSEDRKVAAALMPVG